MTTDRVLVAIDVCTSPEPREGRWTFQRVADEAEAETKVKEAQEAGLKALVARKWKEPFGSVWEIDGVAVVVTSGPGA